MINEIQKQYDRLDDIPSIMLYMEEVYAVPDRHIRYAATKAFFRDQDGRRIVSAERGFDLQGERQGCQTLEEEEGQGNIVTATASTRGAPPATLKRKGKGKVRGSQRSKANDVCMHCQGKGHWKRECPQLLPTQVLERSRRLSKDEMILRLVDGKAVAAEAVGSLSLVGKMTKKPFVGQSAIANGLLDLVHTDVCRPLSILARGGFSYFITFTDDHSRYGYVYLMGYKSEAFERFKEYRLEVENQTNRKIKALRSDRGGEYLSGEFIGYSKENGILSQWTPPGIPKLNRVAERRNRTLLDMVRSMMSFTELPPSFWGYALETAAKLLNIAPSKSIPQTPYEIWHGKPASYKYLRVWGSPAYVKRLVGDKLDSRSSLCSRRDEIMIEESSEEPQHDSTTSFKPTVHTDGVSILRRSTKESEYLRDPPKGARPVGCKWVYKRKIGADGEVMALKARLMAYTQRPGVDFEETYSPVAMAISIGYCLP
ncbi:UNVERIFIED_CONTAM: Transposon Ty2-GR1 Gag-Pol polyprotein [Sesamum radiatum]|uniref:Transposon Ty2-GR1 Gag-Pol polyprotein n=1 Tax=Sesamum radiatum TaxID=300843 RepID=A0AAW2U7K1_SESRA